jgi:hypothetical protein
MKPFLTTILFVQIQPWENIISKNDLRSSANSKKINESSRSSHNIFNKKGTVKQKKN